MRNLYPSEESAEYLRQWRDRDEFMRKAAGIKVIPSKPNDPVFLLPQLPPERSPQWTLAQRSISINSVGNSE